MVTLHAIILNPALSVRGERYEVVEGKTPEITIKAARTLLASINASNLVALRDRAVIAILIYTAARADAVAGLRRGSLYNSGERWMLHFVPRDHEFADNFSKKTVVLRRIVMAIKF